MKAMVRERYGSPDVLEVREVDRPVVDADDKIVVSVAAAGVNPFDWHMLRGKPYLVRLVSGFPRPKLGIGGRDFAGRVVEVGAAVTEFVPGDEVFGMGGGAFAELIRVRARSIVIKPPSVTFDQAAAAPMATITALQALRDKGRLRVGQRVLINGASGGVGTAAIQIAKSLGVHVTAVCSARNLEMVRSLGADEVIDYTAEDFTELGQVFDVMLDCVGSRSLRKCRRVLRPTGMYVSVGAKKIGNWIGPVTMVLRVKVASWLGKPTMTTMLASETKEALADIQGLLASGAVVPVIDRRYPLEEGIEAIKYQGEGHTQGKIVLVMGQQ